MATVPAQPESKPRSIGKGGVAAVAAVGFVAGVAAYQAKKMAVQAITSAQGDWVDTLTAEHRMVEGAFKSLLKTKDHEKVKRASLLTAIAHLLGKHALEEENVLYPELRGHRYEEEASKLYGEHADMKTLIHALEMKDKTDPDWLDKARVLFDLVKSHATEEEELMPLFRDNLTDEQNARLSAQIYREGVKLA